MLPAPELLKRSQYFTPPNTEHPHSSRTHYFDWEEYHRPLARLHQAYLHGWGIASGLAVSVAEDGAGVEVQPGVAIDGNGELIALSPSGQADISLVQPGEAEQQIPAPFRVSANGLTNVQRYLTIQFAERLRFGEGAGGKLEQTPWLRLQPTIGDDAYVDDGASIILALVVIDAAGVITVKTTDAGLAHGRRLLATTSGALHIRRPDVTDGNIEEPVVAHLEPGDGGGLRVSVPAAGDSILFQRQDGGRFAQLAVHANQTDLQGDLLVQGRLQVNGISTFTGRVGIGTDAPNRSFTIEGATESYLNLRTPTGAQELLVGVDANGGTISTLTNHDLRLRAGGNNPQVTLKANGNVGIGTIDPGAFKLKVEGGDTHLSGALTVMGNLTSGALKAGALLVNATGIGIGTTTPQAKVHIEAGSLLVNGESTGVIVDEGGRKRVGFMKYAGREGGIWRLNNQDFEIGRLDAGVTALPGTPTTFTTDLYVASNGNIGIGTTSPSLKLDMRGYNMLTDPTAQYNSHFPFSDNNAYLTGGNIYLRGGAPQGWRVALTVTPTNGNVTIAGKLGTLGWGAEPRTPGWAGGIHTWDIEAEGTMWSRSGYQSGNRDLAENYASTTLLEPGDVVRLDPCEDKVLLSENANDIGVIGVVSTAPGVLLNENHDVEAGKQFPIALCGRVPCKVVTENGPIQRGDLLTSSSTPGHAMKAQPITLEGYTLYRPGTIIGKALETHTYGAGLIEVFVSAS